MAGWSVEATGCGHRFTQRWIFRSLTFALASGSCTAVLGPNGSGKSTLGRMLAGHVVPAEGRLVWHGDGRTIDASDPSGEVPRSTSLAGTGAALPGHLTVREALDWQATFRTVRPRKELEEALCASGLGQHMDAQLRTLSTGMRARVHLAAALGTQSGLVVLDEPTANLDGEGKEWYRALLSTWGSETTVVVCTNTPAEDCPSFENRIDLTRPTAV
jgi:ABC-type multidrug transport system ATPase subunit